MTEQTAGRVALRKFFFWKMLFENTYIEAFGFACEWAVKGVETTAPLLKIVAPFS